jgi:hypothetical protein
LPLTGAGVSAKGEHAASPPWALQFAISLGIPSPELMGNQSKVGEKCFFSKLPERAEPEETGLLTEIRPDRNNGLTASAFM